MSFLANLARQVGALLKSDVPASAADAGELVDVDEAHPSTLCCRRAAHLLFETSVKDSMEEEEALNLLRRPL